MNIIPIFNELHNCWHAEIDDKEYRDLWFQNKEDCQSWIDTVKAFANLLDG